MKKRNIPTDIIELNKQTYAWAKPVWKIFGIPRKNLNKNTKPRLELMLAGRIQQQANVQGN